MLRSKLMIARARLLRRSGAPTASPFFSMPLAAALALSGALACAGSDGSGADAHAADPGGPSGAGEVDPPGTGSGAPPEPGTYPGSYFVPVPAELVPYASFDLEEVRLELHGGELTLRYDLPELLLGNARGISFRGGSDESGIYTLGGDDGVATCQSTASGWDCDEVLSGIDVDVDAVDRILSGLPDREAAARRSVTDRFAVDPIGVLHIESAR